VKRILARRPSPAMIVASLALFVSLSGVSYGLATGFIDSREIKNDTIRAKDLKAQSVGTSELKQNDVRGRDIRNSTVTTRDISFDTIKGEDVRESTLGIVPNADKLDGLDSSAFARGGPAPLMLVGQGGGGPDLGTGFSLPACLNCTPVGFWRDPFGVIHLQGLVHGPASGTIFTLPAGYRPPNDTRFLISSGPTAADQGGLRILPTGAVNLEGGTTNSDSSLDGVTFRTAG
jgi:hypothetical protein